jgi:hypothetical protein
MIHEQLMGEGISPHYEPDEVKRVALALRAAAVYDRQRADAMERWATLLENISEGSKTKRKPMKRGKTNDRSQTA